MANVSSALWRGDRGYFITSGPNGTIESDTARCQHCGQQIFCCDPVTKAPKRAEDCGGMCKCCSQIICSTCVARDVCVPLEEFLATIEGHSRLPKDLQDRVHREFLRRG